MSAVLVRLSPACGPRHSRSSSGTHGDAADQLVEEAHAQEEAGVHHADAPDVDVGLVPPARPKLRAGMEPGIRVAAEDIPPVVCKNVTHGAVADSHGCVHAVASSKRRGK